MEIFITYTLAGLAIALPVGALTIEMVKQGLQNGFLHGWAVGIGGMTIDVLLICALYLGLAQFLSLPYVQTPLWLIGAGFLFFLAWDSFRTADQNITLSGERVQKTFWHTYKNGVIAAISPSNLVFWVSVFGAVLSNTYATAETSSFAIAGMGILTGILLHDVGLLSIVSVTRKVMSPNMIEKTSIVAGVLLFGFGCYFVYRFAQDLRLLW